MQPAPRFKVIDIRPSRQLTFPTHKNADTVLLTFCVPVEIVSTEAVAVENRHCHHHNLAVVSDFSALSHDWTLTLMRMQAAEEARLIGGNLKICLRLQHLLNSCIEVLADISVVFVNRKHYLWNESIRERQFRFTNTNSSFECVSMLSPQKLTSAEFADEYAHIHFQLEIHVNRWISRGRLEKLIHPINHTQFSCLINEFGKLNDRYVMATRRKHSILAAAAPPPTDDDQQQQQQLIYQTSYFVYGQYRWKLVLEPCLDSVGQLGNIRLYLKNDGKFPDGLVSQYVSIKIVYSLQIESSSFKWNAVDSGNATAAAEPNQTTSSYTNHEGKCRSYVFNEIRSLLGNHGSFVVNVNLYDLVVIFPILIFPAASNSSNHKELVVSKFVDQHIGHTWELINKFGSEDDDDDGLTGRLILRMVDLDLAQLPEDMMIMIAFNVTLRCHCDSQRVVSLFESPVLKYYGHEHGEHGLEIDTGLNKSQLRKEGFLDDRQAIHLEIEFYSCCFLNFPSHNSTDDLIARQNVQLVHELRLQQEENRQLEKKLHALQIEARSLETSGRVHKVKFDLPPEKLSISSQLSHLTGPQSELFMPNCFTNVQNPNLDVVKHYRTSLKHGATQNSDDDKSDGARKHDTKQSGNSDKDSSTLQGYLSYFYHSKIQAPLKFINPFSYFEFATPAARPYTRSHWSVTKF